MALACLSACIDHARADTPLQRGATDALNYARIGGLLKGHAVSVTTTGTCIGKNIGSVSSESDCELFEWGTPVSLHANTQAVCACVVMDEDVTIYVDANCGRIDDPNATVTDTTGNNACRYIPANGLHEFIVDRRHFGVGALSASSVSSYRDHACTSPAALVGFPCDADDDCPTGACGSTAAPDSILGAFVMVIGTASTIGWVEDL